MIFLVFVTFGTKSTKWAHLSCRLSFSWRQKNKFDVSIRLSLFSSQKAFLSWLTRTKCTQRPFWKKIFLIKCWYGLLKIIGPKTEYKWVKYTPRKKSFLNNFDLFFLFLSDVVLDEPIILSVLPCREGFCLSVFQNLRSFSYLDKFLLLASMVPIPAQYLHWLNHQSIPA